MITCRLCGGTRGEHVGFDCPEDPTRPAKELVTVTNPLELVTVTNDREANKKRMLEIIKKNREECKREYRSYIIGRFFLNTDKSTQWAYSAGSPTRVNYLMTWGRGFFRHLQVDGQEQLIMPLTPADTFACKIPKDQFLYAVGAQDMGLFGFQKEIGGASYRLMRSVVDYGIDLPTMNAGGRLAFEWEGPLEGIAIMATALIG